MAKIRIIPRLDIKGPNLVKGIHLEGLRVVGKPEIFARHYYEQGADELFFIDVVASLYERNSLDDIISNTAKEIFIPLTVGGGLRTLDDIRKVLRAGADKVSINTAALKNPNFISEAALKFGSSTIVVAIEAIKQPNGKYFAYTDNAREFTGVEVFEWAQKVVELGAGEICITSVDNEGTGIGFDTELIQGVSNLVNVPVIAHGGAGKKEDVLNLVNSVDVNAVAIASMFHYDYLNNGYNHDHIACEEGNLEFLSKKRKVNAFSVSSITDLKEYLKINNISIREINN